MQMYTKLADMYSNADMYLEQANATASQLGALRSKGLSTLSDDEYESYAGLMDTQRSLKREYAMIKDKKDEIDYLLETADIIFNYYEVIDHNSKPLSKPSSSSASASQPPPAHPPSRGILKYFTTDPAPSQPPSPPNQEATKDKNTSSSVIHDRATLLELYLAKTDANYIKKQGTTPTTTPHKQLESCPVCNVLTERVAIPQEGLIFCPHCHAVEPLLVDHERPSYKEPPKEITYFAYKRINHLNEWLSQTQGKESTDIPTEVYDRILLEIRKQRITNMAKVTTAKIKEILKRLGLTKYYEHVTHIMQRLNGLPSIQLKPEVEDKLRQMFKMIQIPFFKHAPKTRKNFLSYSYTIHKCLQLLELDEYLPYFPLLKSREKTFQMDIVWKKICEELNWHFYPSC
jgi:hypothetical protein